MKKEKIAHVYGGGSVKGIWQVGAINYVLSKGIYPDIITGISVGNLNGNLLANRIGYQKLNFPNKKIDWNEASNYIKNFWLSNIQSPSDIINKKSIFKLAYQFIIGKLNSFTDTAPLRKLVYETLDDRFIRNCGLDISSGCVNLEDGKILYTHPKMDNYNQYVMASSVIPFLMPVEEIGNLKYIDGGLIDSAPIKKAIDLGATKIIVFGNHPEKVGFRNINHNNPLQYADRLMEIIVNKTLNNDITEALLINKMLDENVVCDKTKGKRKIDIQVIRPSKTIELKIDNFDSGDMFRVWSDGWSEAEKLLD